MRSLRLEVRLNHGLRTPNEAIFHRNSKFWAGADNLGYFQADLPAPITIFVLFSVNQQKLKPLYPDPK